MKRYGSRAFFYTIGSMTPRSPIDFNSVMVDNLAFVLMWPSLPFHMKLHVRASRWAHIVRVGLQHVVVYKAIAKRT